jgi:hypothetical protein
MGSRSFFLGYDFGQTVAGDNSRRKPVFRLMDIISQANINYYLLPLLPDVSERRRAAKLSWKFSAAIIFRLLSWDTLERRTETALNPVKVETMANLTTGIT